MQNQALQEIATDNRKSKKSESGERPVKLVPYTVWMPAHRAALMIEIGGALEGWAEMWANVWIESAVPEMPASKRQMDMCVAEALECCSFRSTKTKSLANGKVRAALGRFYAVERDQVHTSGGAE